MFVSVPMANNSFGLGMQFVMKGYLEIKQEQAYTFTSLVGNVGGYMGLFLGYAILHFPKLLTVLARVVLMLVLDNLCPGHPFDRPFE